MVLGENWSSASIVIVILFNNNKTPAGGYKIPGVTLVFQNTWEEKPFMIIERLNYHCSSMVCNPLF